MNIGCYFDGCSGVVRGQCPAYSRTNCGRYYCSEHSRDGLCDECYQEKAVDILIEKYSKIAEDIKIHQIKSDKDNLFISNGRAFILGILYIILFSILFYIPSYLIIKALPDSLFALTPSQYERLLDKESWDIWFTIGFELKQKKNLYVLSSLLLGTLTGMIFIIWFVKRQNKRSLTASNKSEFQTICEHNPGFREFYAEWKEEKNRQTLMTVGRIAVGIAAGVNQVNEDRKDREIKNAAYDIAKKHNRRR